ncbi:hypothetical protein Dsin_010590 [Dipteronia sinensis]|uniref:Uncharacterized protein n=1 Tax=Dipteronia sinensis TaxID=43782 RepID=A0AAE0ATJ2_9ROSI|nr:hypothetical protein Dsin_010590 [Dipteronia sinensis]
MSQQTLMMMFKRRSLVRSSQAMLMLSTCKLQGHGLNGHTADTDRQTFKKIMPPVISTYEDIQPDITRIANGDTSPIFCSNPISEFLSISSGTSGGER